MQTVIGILLLVTFFAFIVYAVRGGNLMLGLFIMAVLWSVLGMIGGVIDWTTINTTIFNDGPTGFGSTAIYIVFGSWFGRVMVETGIAGTIIRKATELGGDKSCSRSCSPWASPRCSPPPPSACPSAAASTSTSLCSTRLLAP